MNCSYSDLWKGVAAGVVVVDIVNKPHTESISGLHGSTLS